MANIRNTKDNNNNDEFFERLIETLDSSMKQHAEHWMHEQDEISEKFDDLQKAYAALVERLTSVEAKDFGSAVMKIDSSLKKMISLDHKVESLENNSRDATKTIEELKDKCHKVDNLEANAKDASKIIEELKDKCHRANLIINIALGFFLSVVIPLAIGLIPYLIEMFKTKGQGQ